MLVKYEYHAPIMRVFICNACIKQKNGPDELNVTQLHWCEMHLHNTIHLIVLQIHLVTGILHQEMYIATLLPVCVCVCVYMCACVCVCV